MPERIAGLYKITNKLNGKVYIGISVDIKKRFSNYYWAAMSDREYAETKRMIVQAMKHDGVGNFEFEIIDQGDQYKNPKYRAAKEREYIAMYKSNDPKYGYNEDGGGDTGPSKPRKQHPKERMKRAKPAFLYDTKTGSVRLFFMGCKQIGKVLGHDRTVVTRNNRYGTPLCGRYFIFYANHKRRKEQYEFIKSNIGNPVYYQIPTDPKRFEEYQRAYDYVNEVAKEFGM